MSPLNLGTLFDIPDFETYLSQLNDAIRASLSEADWLISKPALRHVLAPSKRLRPGLILAIMHAAGKKIDSQAITACVAIELVHISSLIHDDIIDKANTRRGIPTINAVEGVDQAIIIGDYLLAQATVEAARVSARAAQIVGSAMTNICNGQALEVADQYNISRDGDTMLRSIRGKTAVLFAAACELGGLCAGLSNTKLAALANYGEQFGMAFQLIDDVLDFVSSEAQLGKPVGNDVAEGVYTMPLLLALHGPSQHEIREELSKKQPATPELVRMLIDQFAIGKTIDVARHYNAQAVKALPPLGGKQSSALANFPEAYLTWCLEHSVASEYDL